jgi:hypothetical protein
MKCETHTNGQRDDKIGTTIILFTGEISFAFSEQIRPCLNILPSSVLAQVHTTHTHRFNLHPPAFIVTPNSKLLIVYLLVRNHYTLSPWENTAVTQHFSSMTNGCIIPGWRFGTSLGADVKFFFNHMQF